MQFKPNACLLLRGPQLKQRAPDILTVPWPQNLKMVRVVHEISSVVWLHWSSSLAMKSGTNKQTSM